MGESRRNGSTGGGAHGKRAHERRLRFLGNGGQFSIQLSRELRRVHSTHGVGVGAFVCQAIEAMEQWDTKLRWLPNRVGKVFASLELRCASEHDILGIRSSGEEIGEDLHMAVEEPKAWGRGVSSRYEEKGPEFDNLDAWLGPLALFFLKSLLGGNKSINSFFQPHGSRGDGLTKDECARLSRDYCGGSKPTVPITFPEYHFYHVWGDWRAVRFRRASARATPTGQLQARRFGSSPPPPVLTNHLRH